VGQRGVLGEVAEAPGVEQVAENVLAGQGGDLGLVLWIHKSDPPFILFVGRHPRWEEIN